MAVLAEINLLTIVTPYVLNYHASKIIRFWELVGRKKGFSDREIEFEKNLKV